jgi:hypothetical protein
MVKQSRRQVGLKKRSMRRRTMKGGVYDPANKGPYIRRKSILGIGSTPLYRLKIDKTDPQYNKFELDFSVVTGFGDTVMSRRIETVKLEYTRILTEIYPGISEVNIADIKEMIELLFQGGIPGAKTKKLQLEENNRTPEVIVKLINTATNAELKQISLNRVYPSFEFFLFKLSNDDIMPETPSAAPTSPETNQGNSWLSRMSPFSKK